MTVKVYISRTSGDNEVKQRQQRVLLILELKNIHHEVVDVADAENREKRDFMQQNASFFGGTTVEPSPVHPLPPQIFNDDDYCGDYERLESANENGQLEIFLKVVPPESEIRTSTAECRFKES